MEDDPVNDNVEAKQIPWSQKPVEENRLFSELNPLNEKSLAMSANKNGHNLNPSKNKYFVLIPNHNKIKNFITNPSLLYNQAKKMLA